MKKYADKNKRAGARRRGLCVKLLPQIIAGCFGCGAALANPLGPQVVNGQVSIVNQGNTLAITNSPGAIINWQSFSINANETTRFIQENSSSSVLNRIIGQDPSQILGALQSNGQVFLINPNGIIFGAGAQVDVGGLVASTLNLSNEDFLAGKRNFNIGQSAGNIQNQGAITTSSGGRVYLIAPNVENSGIITSPQGEVILAAGHSVQLVESTNPDLHVVISAPENQTINLGQVISQGGKIGIYGALVNQRGSVNADSAVIGENGKIVLRASRDTLLEDGSRTSATGLGTGGEIHLLGQRVGLSGDAKVDASGALGGGTVLVGGDYQGKNPDIVNAQRTYFGPNAQIKADAIENGDGGRVIVWADDSTQAYGKISVRGGEQGGNGGFVETSGKQNLDFKATVDTRASNGRAGSLLLDPSTLTIVSGSGADDSEVSDGLVQFGDLPSGMIIGQTTLEGLSSTTNLMLEATGQITINAMSGGVLNLAQSAGYSVTLNSTTSGGISMDNLTDRIVTAGANVSLIAGGSGSLNIGRVQTNGGTVTMNAAGSLSVKEVLTTPGAGNGANISLTSGGLMTLGGGGQIDARHASAGAANVTLNSGGGISLQNGNTIYADQLKMFAASGIYGSSSVDDLSIEVNALQAKNTGVGVVRISNSGSGLSVEDIGGLGYGLTQQSAGQTLSLKTYGNLGVNASILTNNAALSVEGGSGITMTASKQIASSGGAISLVVADESGFLSMPAGSLINSGGGNVQLQADKMSLLGAVQATGASVTLASKNSQDVHLGTGNTDSLTALELSSNELNTITANKLIIGGSTASAINIMGAIAPAGVSGALVLTSTGAIAQQSGATIAVPSLKVTGSSVALNESNGVGVIAGSSSGSFQYRSANKITLSTVDGTSGINAGANSVRLESDSNLGINQSSGSAIVAGGLALKTKGPVLLTDSGNNIGSVAADLLVGGTGSGEFSLYSASNLTVDGPIFSLSGITTNNQRISLATGAGQTLTINQAINAGSGAVDLKMDNLTMGATTVTAGADVGLKGASNGRAITVGSVSCAQQTCLSLTDLYKFVTPTIGIGGAGGINPAGDIHVAGITNGTSAATDINGGITTRIGLLSGGSITQGGAITLQDLGVEAGGSVSLNAANVISNIAGKANGNMSFNSTLANLSVITASGASYLLTGLSSNGGSISLTSGGNLNVASVINAGAGNVTLNAASGAISGAALITAAGLDASASNGIGALNTKVSTLTASNTTSGNIAVINTGALTLNNVQQLGSGNIDIDNTGAITVAAGKSVSSNVGSTKLVAHSPLDILGTVSSTSGALYLEAGSSGLITDNLTISGVVTSGTGNITLKAGNAIYGTATTSGLLTLLSFQNTPVLSTLLTQPGTGAPLQQVLDSTLTTLDKSLVQPGELILADKDAGSKTDESDTTESGKTGAKNEPAKKMYCN